MIGALILIGAAGVAINRWHRGPAYHRRRREIRTTPGWRPRDRRRW